MNLTLDFATERRLSLQPASVSSASYSRFGTLTSDADLAYDYIILWAKGKKFNVNNIFGLCITMPYSISHAVIALPLSKLTNGKLPIAALAVGSMSPDFPYLVALTPTHAPGHSILGVLLYCFVPSMIILYGWYRWIERPTLDFWRLPQRSSSTEPPSIPLTVLGVLIGALSHVLWDATSHSYGSIVSDSVFWNTDFISLPAYKWNQYGSGILGLVVLGLWYLYRVLEHLKTPYFGEFGLGVLLYIVSILSLVSAANIIHQTSSILDFSVRTSIGVMSGGVIAAIIYAIIVRSTRAS